MLAALFLRITGVHWDEFRVAWRLYNAHHGMRLRLLAFVLASAAILYGVVTMHMVFPAIDLDGSGSFFLALKDITWRKLPQHPRCTCWPLPFR